MANINLAALASAKNKEDESGYAVDTVSTDTEITFNDEERWEIFSQILSLR